MIFFEMFQIRGERRSDNCHVVGGDSRVRGQGINLLKSQAKLRGDGVVVNHGRLWIADNRRNLQYAQQRLVPEPVLLASTPTETLPQSQEALLEGGERRMHQH